MVSASPREWRICQGYGALTLITYDRMKYLQITIHEINIYDQRVCFLNEKKIQIRHFIISLEEDSK